jgi:chorismate synthase
MAGSIFGNIFKVSTWGESHGKGVGVVVDGCPAGLSLSENDIQLELNKRKPGQSPFSTPRKEGDIVEIMSGVFEGKTTGTPISLIVHNTNQRSKDYSNIKNIYRPGHADYTFDSKYGFRDYRGGGRSSGRETIGRVASGAIAKKLLSQLDISITGYTYSIGNIKIDKNKLDYKEIYNNSLCIPDKNKVSEAEEYLKELISEGNSAGGIIECEIDNIPAGVGEPVFEKLDANLSKAVMSIGSVKAVEIGSGINVSHMTGLENNDNYSYTKNEIIKSSNNSGGILGGISDGSKVLIRAHIKPTPSIHASQQTVDKLGNDITINIEGRHDPIIVPRAVVVVESMVALTVMDMLLINMSSRIDYIKKVYNC